MLTVGLVGTGGVYWPGDVAVCGSGGVQPGPRVGCWVVLVGDRVWEGGGAYRGAGGDGQRLPAW